MNKEELITKIREQAQKINGETFVFNQQICFVCNGDYIVIHEDKINMLVGCMAEIIDIMDNSNDLEGYDQYYLETLLYSMTNNVVDVEITIRNKI